MLDVPGDANADLGDEDDQQEERERQNHAAGLAQRSTAAEKRDNKDHRAHNHQHDGRRPERLADEVLVVVIRVLNDGTDNNREQSRHLKNVKREV